MGFDYTKGQVYLRDGFVPFSDANVSIASSPVLYGLSVYTVFSANWNEKEEKLYAFRLRDHYDRLINSARIMDFNVFAAQWPYERFASVMAELLSRNIIRENVLVRVTIFIDALIAGTKIHDLPQALAAYVYPMGEILPRSGAKVCVSSWTRNADNAIPSRAKVNGSYANASLMKNEAILNGYDDAIALDAAGHVTEGTVANIFLVRKGTLVTPHAGADILEGITRDSVIRIAQDLHIPVETRAIDRSELYIADEIFLCGSSARVTPVVSVDKRMVGNGMPGPIMAQLSEVYRAAQHGENTLYNNWLFEIKTG
jgi:branched-chain amino acid aminotransferase